MKLNKAFLLFLPFVFSTALANDELEKIYDVPSYKNIAKLKERQLIVIVNPPDPSIVGKFDRKDMPQVVQEYLQIINNYNDNMKFYTTKFWNFSSQPVLYKTRTEIEDMMRDKSQRDKYYFMYCYTYSRSININLQYTINHSGTKIEGTPAILAIGLYNESPMFKQELGLVPTMQDMSFWIPALNSAFNFVYTHKEKPTMTEMMDENAHILSTKTLLIPKDNVSPDVKSEISHYYPCRFKLVSYDEIQRAIANADTNYAYVIKQVYQLIINCSDGAGLGYSSKNMYSYEIKKDFFLEAADFCSAGRKK